MLSTLTIVKQTPRLTHIFQQQLVMSKRSSTGNVGASKKLKLAAPGSLDHMTLPPELEGKIDFNPKCKTKDDQPWNLKIISWNINGIRAVLKSKKLHYLKFEDPDIVCLQETKCVEADMPEEAKFLGYHKYYCSAEKKGYSSTALYSKVKPLSVTYGIGKAEHDNEGRVITAEFESFYLVNVYVPNSGQKVVRLPYRRTWNTDFLSYCKSLDSKKPLVVAGDLNVAHTAIDLARPKSNVKNAGFTPEEREDFSTWLDNGFVDTFRHFYPEKTGAYTFWTYMSNARAKNIGWRLDYFVASERFVKNVAACEIREMVLGSDHCPLMLLVADPARKSKVPDCEAQVANSQSNVTEDKADEDVENAQNAENVENVQGEQDGEKTGEKKEKEVENGSPDVKEAAVEA